MLKEIKEDNWKETNWLRWWMEKSNGQYWINFSDKDYQWETDQYIKKE